MAVLGEAERIFIRDAVARSRPIGQCTKPELKAAIDATDNWIDANQSGYNAALPDPFRSLASLDEKTVLFCYVALKRAGLLLHGGV